MVCKVADVTVRDLIEEGAIGSGSRKKWPFGALMEIPNKTLPCLAVPTILPPWL